MPDHIIHLAQQLAIDGPAAHHQALVRLADLARDRAPGAAAALADPEAPPVVRLRAFTLVVRWLDQTEPTLLDAVA